MLGRRKRLRQPSLFIRRDEIPEPPGAVFYRKLNELLAKHRFDERAEELCAPYYAEARWRLVLVGSLKQVQRKQWGVCERTCAHVCDTGASRRVWLQGLTEVKNWYLVRVMGYNLGVILRLLFGLSKPRSLTGVGELFYFIFA
ncbi:MAG: hypothetical protein D6741_11195, partial [Planctomycetota bacterium]